MPPLDLKFSIILLYVLYILSKVLILPIDKGNVGNIIRDNTGRHIWEYVGLVSPDTVRQPSSSMELGAYRNSTIKRNFLRCIMSSGFGE